jgi:hypothetical protein
MYVLSKAEKRPQRESREYVGRWRKNQVTMAVAAKLGETFLLLLDDRQLAADGVWRRRWQRLRPSVVLGRGHIKFSQLS